MIFKERDVRRCARKRVYSVMNDLPTLFLSAEHGSFNRVGLSSAKHGGSGRRVSRRPSAYAITDELPDTSVALSLLAFALARMMNAIKYFVLTVQARRA